MIYYTRLLFLLSVISLNGMEKKIELLPIESKRASTTVAAKRYSTDTVLKECLAVYEDAYQLDGICLRGHIPIEKDTVLQGYAKVLACLTDSALIDSKKSLDYVSLARNRLLFFAQEKMKESPKYTLSKEIMVLCDAVEKIQVEQKKQLPMLDLHEIKMFENPKLEINAREAQSSYSKIIDQQYKRIESQYTEVISAELAKKSIDLATIYLNAGKQKRAHADLLIKQKETQEVLQDQYYVAFADFINAYNTANASPRKMNEPNEIGFAEAEEALSRILEIEKELYQKNPVEHGIPKRLTKACEKMRKAREKREKYAQKSSLILAP
jgi:hypothetical protein